MQVLFWYMRVLCRKFAAHRKQVAFFVWDEIGIDQELSSGVDLRRLAERLLRQAEQNGDSGK